MTTDEQHFDERVTLLKAHLSQGYLTAFALAALLLAVTPARAQTRTVTLNTGLLNGAGTFYVEYALSDAFTVGNATAVISNFSLTGGALGAVLPPTTGDVTGDLGSALTLRDDNAAAGGNADFAQAFTVSSNTSTLTFNLNLSTSSVNAGNPDDFQFQILDNAQFNLPLATNGPTGVELVNARYNLLSPTPVGYTTQATTTLAPGSVDTGFPGIKATITTAPVPESSTMVSLGLLLALGLGGLVVSAWRRKATPLR